MLTFFVKTKNAHEALKHKINLKKFFVTWAFPYWGVGGGGLPTHSRKKAGSQDPGSFVFFRAKFGKIEKIRKNRKNLEKYFFSKKLGKIRKNSEKYFEKFGKIL